MRTKTLLLAAALGLAAIAVTFVTSSKAQVYSGVVGYMNLGLSNGYTLVSQQLASDGTGTNNNVNTFFSTNLPVGSAVLAWNPSGGAYFPSANWINSKGVLKWTGDTNDVNAALQSGQGVFVQTPGTNLTVVGNVLQGTNIYNLTAGYNLLSFNAPISGGITTVLGYAPSVGDTVTFWIRRHKALLLLLITSIAKAH